MKINLQIQPEHFFSIDPRNLMRDWVNLISKFEGASINSITLESLDYMIRNILNFYGLKQIDFNLIESNERVTVIPTNPMSAYIFLIITNSQYPHL